MPRVGGVVVEDGWEFFVDTGGGVLGVGDRVAVMRSGRQGLSGRVGEVVRVGEGNGKVNVTIIGGVALPSQLAGNFRRVRQAGPGL